MERPKSDNLIWPSLSIRMLSGLMSLYQDNPRREKIINNRAFVSGYAQDDPQIAVFRSPMYETEVVHSLNRKNALGNVEPRNILREGVVLDQHRHQVSSSQELHDEVQV